MKIHYAGEIRYTTASGWSRHILPGWAACCSGDRAIAIRYSEQHTLNRDEVTCKPCLKAIEQHDLCLQRSATGDR